MCLRLVMGNVSRNAQLKSVFTTIAIPVKKYFEKEKANIN